MANLPRRLGRYDIVATIAKGRASDVYLAYARAAGASSEPPGPIRGSTAGQRSFAAKRIAEHVLRSKERIPAFVESIRVAAGVQHRNVATIHEVDHVDDHLFIVSDYLLGETATALLRR